MKLRLRVLVAALPLALPAVAVASCQAPAGGAGGGGLGAGGAPGAGSAGGSTAAVFFMDVFIPPAVDCGSADASHRDAAPPACTAKNPAVSFASDVNPILRNCGNQDGCHGSPTYDTLVNMPATECCDGRQMVTPGDPSGSYLIDKVTGKHLCFGGRMPFGLPALPAEEIQTFEDWICLGAKRN